MSATLSLLKLPILSSKKQHEPKPKISIPSKYSVTTLLPQQCQDSYNPQKLIIHDTFDKLRSASIPLTALTFPFFLDAKDALAAGGEFGIFEGRSFALIHPIVMSGLFVYTLYSGYLGWQWRRVRTIQNEINELKKEVKPVPVTPEGTPVEPPKPSPVEAKIQQLTEERKELIKGSYKEKHFNAGSILLGFGVFESIFGGLNTWLRTGRLFPGPHLFAGAVTCSADSMFLCQRKYAEEIVYMDKMANCKIMSTPVDSKSKLSDVDGNPVSDPTLYKSLAGITVLWAAAAALVPAMQKGNETARNLHIALNALNVILFIWQIPTGIDTVFKVFEFTKWP